MPEYSKETLENTSQLCQMGSSRHLKGTIRAGMNLVQLRPERQLKRKSLNTYRLDLDKNLWGRLGGTDPQM